MIGCLGTRVRKQPIIALYFEYENELKFFNLDTRCLFVCTNHCCLALDGRFQQHQKFRVFSKKE